MSWTDVRLAGDPAPGDPEGVRALAQMAGEAAGEFQRAQTFVAGIADGSEIRGVWSGLAADAFKVRAKDFDPELVRAETSFTRLSAALFTWRSQLTDLQERAATCLSAALRAHQEVDDARRDLWWAEAEYDRADPPFDTSRDEFLKRYRTTLDYWQGCFDAQIAIAEELAGEHTQKAGRVAQAVVDASKAGFRGDNLWEKTQTYAGYLGEELGDLAEAGADWVVRVVELYAQLEALKLQLLTGQISPAEFLDKYTKKLDTLLYELTLVTTVMSLIPPLAPLAKALDGVHVLVKVTRYAIYDDGDLFEIGRDAALSLVPKGARHFSGKQARLIAKADNYVAGTGWYSEAAQDFVGKHVTSMLYWDDIASGAEAMKNAIVLYEKYEDPLVRELAGERPSAAPEVHVRPCTVRPITPFILSPTLNLFGENAYVR